MDLKPTNNELKEQVYKLASVFRKENDFMWMQGFTESFERRNLTLNQIKDEVNRLIDTSKFPPNPSDIIAVGYDGNEVSVFDAERVLKKMIKMRLGQRKMVQSFTYELDEFGNRHKVKIDEKVWYDEDGYDVLIHDFYSVLFNRIFTPVVIDGKKKKDAKGSTVFMLSNYGRKFSVEINQLRNWDENFYLSWSNCKIDDKILEELLVELSPSQKIEQLQMNGDILISQAKLIRK